MYYVIVCMPSWHRPLTANLAYVGGYLFFSTDGLDVYSSGQAVEQAPHNLIAVPKQ